MSDLIKLVLTSSDAHLSNSAALCRLTLIPIRTGITKQVRTTTSGCGVVCEKGTRCLTGGETVTAGVALQLLFAVFAVKVIFAG